MLPPIPDIEFAPRRFIAKFISLGWTLVDPELDGSGWAVLMRREG